MEPLKKMTELLGQKKKQIKKIEDEFESEMRGLNIDLEHEMRKLVPDMYYFRYNYELGEMSFYTRTRVSKDVLLKICESTLMDLEDFQIKTSMESNGEESLVNGIWLPFDYREEYVYTFSDHFYCETISRIKSQEMRNE